MQRSIRTYYRAHDHIAQLSLYQLPTWHGVSITALMLHFGTALRSQHHTPPGLRRKGHVSATGLTQPVNTRRSKAPLTEGR